MKIKEEIYNYLQTQQLMALATFGEEYPWPAIVYFIADEDLNLYFISHPDDQHSKNIEHNNHVAVAIFNSNQPNFDDKIGVQYFGTVKTVKNLKKVTW